MVSAASGMLIVWVVVSRIIISRWQSHKINRNHKQIPSDGEAAINQLNYIVAAIPFSKIFIKTLNFILRHMLNYLE